MAVSGLQKRTVNHVPATVPADIIPLLSCQKLSAAEQSAIAKKILPQYAEQTLFRMNTRYILLTVWVEYSDVPQKIIILQK